MSEPTDLPAPEDSTRLPSPSDMERREQNARDTLLPPPQFASGDPVPNRSTWTLVERLGQGGFGEVWQAKHEWKPDLVAVKFCIHPTAKLRLITHEKIILTRVMKYAGEHPNIVPL